MNDKPIYVAFVSKKLESDFGKLQKGKFEDKQLYNFIERAINDLKKNPMCELKFLKSYGLEIMLKSTK